MKLLKLQPKIKIKNQRLYSGAAIEKPQTTNTTLAPIPEDVSQQPQAIRSIIIHKNPTTEIHKKTHMPEFRQKKSCRITIVVNKGNLTLNI